MSMRRKRRFFVVFSKIPSKLYEGGGINKCLLLSGIKGEIYLVLINKDEATAIRERFHDVCITRTSIQNSKRHRYYVTEDRRVMRFLDDMRRENVLEIHRPPRKKRGV